MKCIVSRPPFFSQFRCSYTVIPSAVHTSSDDHDGTSLAAVTTTQKSSTTTTTTTTTFTKTITTTTTPLSSPQKHTVSLVSITPQRTPAPALHRLSSASPPCRPPSLQASQEPRLPIPPINDIPILDDVPCMPHPSTFKAMDVSNPDSYYVIGIGEEVGIFYFW